MPGYPRLSVSVMVLCAGVLRKSHQALLNRAAARSPQDLWQGARLLEAGLLAHCPARWHLLLALTLSIAAYCSTMNALCNSGVPWQTRPQASNAQSALNSAKLSCRPVTWQSLDGQ